MLPLGVHNVGKIGAGLVDGRAQFDVNQRGNAGD